MPKATKKSTVKKSRVKKKVVVRKVSAQKKNVPKKTAARKAVSPLANKAMLAAGQPAPEFTLPNDEGQLVSLADYRGQKVVLYFYPEDDTPGCTKEACSFRDGLSAIHLRRAVVLGVSADTVASHVKFKQKFHLTFPLLSDIDKTVCNAYGVWQEKQMFGRRFWGIVRTTFIIDEAGNIAKIFPKVKVDDHYVLWAIMFLAGCISAAALWRIDRKKS